MPIPVISQEKDGVVYRQRTFVAPCDAAGGSVTLFRGGNLPPVGRPPVLLEFDPDPLTDAGSIFVG